METEAEGRQTGVPADRRAAKSYWQAGKFPFFFFYYCPVKESFDVIALDNPIPFHPRLPHSRHRKHTQSPSIIHSIHQIHLNTTSMQAVVSVCLFDLAVGSVCLSTRAWTVIRSGCLSEHTRMHMNASKDTCTHMYHQTTRSPFSIG